MKYHTKLKITPWLFIAPFLFVFVAFSMYPVIYSIILSFGRYKGNVVTLVGLRNYEYLLKDKNFLLSIGNTFRIGLIQVPIMVGLALVLAVFLNSRLIRVKGFFRTSIFMPVLIDAVSYSIIFSILFNDNGFINSALVALGQNRLNWYMDTGLATLIIVIAQTWKWVGYNSVIILGGLQSIPIEMYEAASIDGATGIQAFWHITLPSLRNVLLLVMITSVNGAVQMFTEPNIITHGGPTNSTLTIMLHLYNIGFKNFNFGVASAGSYVVVLIVVILTLIQFRAGKEE